MNCPSAGAMSYVNLLWALVAYTKHGNYTVQSICQFFITNCYQTLLMSWLLTVGQFCTSWTVSVWFRYCTIIMLQSSCCFFNVRIVSTMPCPLSKMKLTLMNKNSVLLQRTITRCVGRSMSVMFSCCARKMWWGIGVIEINSVLHSLSKNTSFLTSFVKLGVIIILKKEI